MIELLSPEMIECSPKCQGVAQRNQLISREMAHTQAAFL